MIWFNTLIILFWRFFLYISYNTFLKFLNSFGFGVSYFIFSFNLKLSSFNFKRSLSSNFILCDNAEALAISSALRCSSFSYSIDKRLEEDFELHVSLERTDLSSDVTCCNIHTFTKSFTVLNLSHLTLNSSSSVICSDV